MPEFKVMTGDAPPPVPFRGRHTFVYEQAEELKPGEWFEWIGGPKQLHSSRKRFREISKDLTVYRTRDNKVIVKNEAEPKAVPAAAKPTTNTAGDGIYVPARATPIPREQREAAATRARQA